MVYSPVFYVEAVMPFSDIIGGCWKRQTTMMPRGHLKIKKQEQDD
jgi:hypothetical protein